MTIQEKIKEAYGNYWAEALNEKVNASGYIILIYERGQYTMWNGVTLEKHPTDNHYYRPITLHGLEDNNGWIKIETESDLPKDKFRYSFVYSLKDKTISSVQFNIVRNDQLEELFEGDWITHYKPITKPEPPIY